MKKLLEILVCCLHPIAVVLMWIDLAADRPDLGEGGKLAWGTFGLIPFMPFLYVLTGGDLGKRSGPRPLATCPSVGMTAHCRGRVFTQRMRLRNLMRSSRNSLHLQPCVEGEAWARSRITSLHPWRRSIPTMASS
jgi:hypothetical protein